MKKIYETASKPTQIILWNMFNERTCKMAADIEELHNKGAHSVANQKQDVLDELDNIARELGIID